MDRHLCLYENQKWWSTLQARSASPEARFRVRHGHTSRRGKKKKKKKHRGILLITRHLDDTLAIASNLQKHSLLHRNRCITRRKMSSQEDPGLRELPVDALSIIERACSVPSMLGSLLVIATFCLSKAFHKPINRLVFYASFGNLMTNAATLMARSFLGDGNSAAGCQFQAFLIQMCVSRWLFDALFGLKHAN